MTNFTMAQALVEATQILRRGGVTESRRDAATLLAHLIGRDQTYLIAHAERELSGRDVARYRSYVERRSAGEPLQYIVGHQEFYNLNFEVSPDVLIPRPETELLVETALKLLGDGADPPSFCDVGTGSGCIAISILHERSDLRAVGVDISAPALAVAARNAERHGVADRLSLVESDCFDQIETTDQSFSLVAANPPYVTAGAYDGLEREVREHEPRIALTPGGDGLDVVRRVIHDAPPYLVSGGHLLIEIGFGQHEVVRSMIDTDVWTLLDIHRDLQGIPRTVALRKK
jgi:release factor glutamine methyltransferase